MRYWNDILAQLAECQFFLEKITPPYCNVQNTFLFYENLKTYHRPVGTWWGSAWERSVGCRCTSPHPGAPDHLFWQTNKYYKSTILTKSIKFYIKKVRPSEISIRIFQSCKKRQKRYAMQILHNYTWIKKNIVKTPLSFL